MRKTLAFLAFSLLAILPRSVNAQQTTIRVNCGGGSYKDSHGQVWQSDTGFIGGTYDHWTKTVAGTPDPLLYEDFRWNPTSYSFKVPNGQYHVNLYFAESAPGAQFVGARVFDISLQGTRAFTNFDIFAEVGGNAALIKTANVNVTNGVVTIGFAPVAGLLAIISAIEILPGVAPPTLTMNFKYPDGTPVLGKLNYAVTSSLMNFNGAADLLNGRAEAVLFSNPSALGISAQFTVNLNLTDSAGHQLWKLAVGMNPSGVNLTDVQSSMLTVIVQKSGSAALTLQHTSVYMGSDPVGVQGTPANVLLTSTGTASVVISDIATGGTNGADFHASYNCVTTLAPGQACTLSIYFKPLATGTRTGEVIIYDNSSTGKQYITLTGTGN